jgi:hypothetical protein
MEPTDTFCGNTPIDQEFVVRSYMSNVELYVSKNNMLLFFLKAVTPARGLRETIK